MHSFNLDPASRAATTDALTLFSVVEVTRQSQTESFGSHLENAQRNPPPPHSSELPSQPDRTPPQEKEPQPESKQRDSVGERQHQQVDPSQTSDDDQVPEPDAGSDDTNLESQEADNGYSADAPEVPTSNSKRSIRARSNRVKLDTTRPNINTESNVKSNVSSSAKESELTNIAGSQAENGERNLVESDESQKANKAADQTAIVAAIDEHKLIESPEIPTGTSSIAREKSERDETAVATSTTALNVAEIALPLGLQESEEPRSRPLVRSESRGGTNVSLDLPVSVDAVTMQMEGNEKSNSEDRSAIRNVSLSAVSDATPMTAENLPTATNPQLRFIQHLAAKPGERVSRTPITDVEHARLVDRVTRAFRTAEARGGLLTLRLHPPELGALRMELRVQEGALTARLEAETPAARSLLVENVQILRDRLAEQGVRIERFDVDLMDHRQFGDAQAFEQPAPREQPPHRDFSAAKPQTELTEAESILTVRRPDVTGEINVII